MPEPRIAELLIKQQSDVLERFTKTDEENCNTFTDDNGNTLAAVDGKDY